MPQGFRTRKLRLITVLGASAALASALPAVARPTEAQALAAESRLFSVFSGPSLDAISDILSDRLTYIHPTGQVMNKAEVVENFRKGPLPRYQKVEGQQLKVQSFGRSAIVTGDVAYTGLPRPGSPPAAPSLLRLSTVWAEEKDGLKLVHWQVTSVPPPAPAVIAPTKNPAAAVAGAYTVDPRHVAVVFRTPHNNGVSFSWFRMNDVTGSLDWNPLHPEASKVSIKIAAKSLDTNVPGFADLLTGPAYLDAEKFADITFVSTAVRPMGPSTGEIAGDLTVHGVTKQVTLQTELVGAGKNARSNLLGFTAKTAIKRSDFGVGPSNPLVGDLLDVAIDLEFMRPNS